MLWRGERRSTIVDDVVMADIVLGECSGQAWLVRGEQHIDHLLANTLEDHVSIKIVACESKSAVDALFCAEGGDDPAMMWLIHPAIVNRARGQGGEMTVRFPPWSAQLDDAALATLQAAAALAARHEQAAVRLVRHLPANGVAMLMDLADLRTGLIQARLAALGVLPGRIVRETETAVDEGGVGGAREDVVAVLIRPG